MGGAGVCARLPLAAVSGSGGTPCGLAEALLLEGSQGQQQRARCARCCKEHLGDGGATQTFATPRDTGLSLPYSPNIAHQSIARSPPDAHHIGAAG